jgi:UDP-N-acetylmuramoyl-L-alanyl-D-glutamate--2,6-diaminopimelate ligase
MEQFLRKVERYIPKKLYRFLQPYYHYLLAIIGNTMYGFPSRKIHVIGITGTKGKSSTTEFVNAILEAKGYKTAVLSTITFKIGNDVRPNKFKMTMPGRFFVQKFLYDAVQSGCEYAIIEMTSEGARFYRHKGIAIDTLIFTNLSPEHIESHGSFNNYLNAKLRLAKAVAKSSKSVRRIIANRDNQYGAHFMIYDVDHNVPYSLKELEIIKQDENESVVSYNGTSITIPLSGTFNIYNALASIKYAETQEIDLETIKRGIESLKQIRGRVEKVTVGNEQNFTVVVDYAHTDDSLKKLYETFKQGAVRDGGKMIAVLGGTGGGRDTWKRRVMGAIADEYCEEIILTNEDPYDEDPEKIVAEIKEGITKHSVKVIMDRREAIRDAIHSAKKYDVVLITGKGTDPYIMGPNGTKEVWDDATVAREELNTLFNK